MHEDQQLRHISPGEAHGESWADAHATCQRVQTFAEGPAPTASLQPKIEQDEDEEEHVLVSAVTAALSMPADAARATATAPPLLEECPERLPAADGLNCEEQHCGVHSLCR